MKSNKNKVSYVKWNKKSINSCIRHWEGSKEMVSVYLVIILIKQRVYIYTNKG